ncbi:hypothetical protein [Allorhizobium ampelinum]|uniref:hypothetical protein n=1 Tax=Allorhizobium ampelinum TaxID=3025782 RepID=UPI003CC8DF01
MTVSKCSVFLVNRLKRFRIEISFDCVAAGIDSVGLIAPVAAPDGANIPALSFKLSLQTLSGLPFFQRHRAFFLSQNRACQSQSDRQGNQHNLHIDPSVYQPINGFGELSPHADNERRKCRLSTRLPFIVGCADTKLKIRCVQPSKIFLKFRPA